MKKNLPLLLLVAFLQNSHSVYAEGLENSLVKPQGTIPESHKMYLGASGLLTQMLCQSDEWRKEDKFIGDAVLAQTRLSTIHNPDEIASLQKKELDKKKIELVKKIFQIDYNGDGKVSLEEVTKYEQIRQREFDKLPKRSDGVKTDTDNPQARALQLMKNDTNKDGIIEYNELMKANGFLSSGVMAKEAQKQALSRQYAEQKQAEKDSLTKKARTAFAAVDLNKDHMHSKEECDAYAAWLQKISKGL